MAKRLMVALSSAVEGREDEFNEWYENVHIPDICSIEGVLNATRYELEEGGFPIPQRYLTIYEIDRPGDEIAAAIGEGVASGAFTLTDSIDAASGTLNFWGPC
jgi:hypothetical protein